jgi:calcineurin-like phosphoesterase family protein
MNTWFTSDWHFFGTNFLKNEKRQHFESVEVMNETIINNLLSSIKPGDNLYFLGDIGWKLPNEWLFNFLVSMKKHKINFFWIEGNHDHKTQVPFVSSLKWKGQIKDIKVEGQKLTLCHYPMYTWNASHYNSYSLHGHIHYKDATWNKLVDNKQVILGKVMNVNCELYDFKPLTFTEIHSILTAKADNWDLIQKHESFYKEEE